MISHNFENQNQNNTFSLNIIENRFILKIIEGKDTLEQDIQTSLISGQWMHFVYAYDNNNVSLSVRSEDIYINQRIYIPFKGQRSLLYIGKNKVTSNNSFSSIIDEIRLYDENKFLYSKKEHYNLYRDKALTKNPPNKLETFFGRTNFLPFEDTLKVLYSKAPTLEIWDDDRKDGDYVKIYLNKDELTTIKLKRKATSIPLDNLQPGLNKLIFYADKMGKENRFNTAAINLIGFDKLKKDVDVVSDSTRNAVVYILKDSIDLNTLDVLRKPIYRNLYNGTIRTRDKYIFVEFSDFSGNEKDLIGYSLNESKFQTIDLALNPKRIKLELEEGQNLFTLQSHNPGSGKTTPKIIFFNSIGEALTQNPIKRKIKVLEDFTIPIIYDPYRTTVDSISVDIDSLTLKFTDVGKEDGDLIEVVLNDYVIKSGLLITTKVQELKIELSEKAYNILEIMPIEMGRIPGVSCRLEVWDKRNQHKFSEFHINSFSRHKPAVLKIKKVP